METPDQAFARGQEAGIVKARLDGHDQRFAVINGSIERFGTEMKLLTLEIQRLADEARARDTTAIATALALEKAEQARRDSSEQTWSPLQRLSLVAGVIVGIIASVAALGGHF
jgi:hypothetical protein